MVTRLILTDLFELDKIDKFVVTCFQVAGKNDNLQLACDVLGFVKRTLK